MIWLTQCVEKSKVLGSAVCDFMCFVLLLGPFPSGWQGTCGWVRQEQRSLAMH